MTHPEIRRIEELSINAYPALSTLLYDGWVLRFSGGFTRRANAVHPLGESSLPLDEKIAVCEAAYRAAGLPVVFKLTGFRETDPPSPLEQALIDRGYALDSLTSLYRCALKPPSAPPFPAIRIENTLTQDWLSAFIRLEGIAPEKAPIVQMMRQRVALPTGCLSLLRDGQIVGLAQGVVEGDWLGVYSVIVDESQRGRGFGMALMQAVMIWGWEAGARRSYLQVKTDNVPALRLYQRLGYTEVYRYWYRQKT